MKKWIVDRLKEAYPTQDAQRAYVSRAMALSALGVAIYLVLDALFR